MSRVGAEAAAALGPCGEAVRAERTKGWFHAVPDTWLLGGGNSSVLLLFDLSRVGGALRWCHLNPRGPCLPGQTLCLLADHRGEEVCVTEGPHPQGAYTLGS